MVNTKTGFIVKHREYIGDVPANHDFTNFVFPINPGIKDTFPWLSYLAQQFEEWRPRGMIFYFKSTSSASVVNVTAVPGVGDPSLGFVAMATDYNAVNPPFSSNLEMQNYEYGTSCKPSVDMIHVVECAKRHNPLATMYVRTEPLGNTPADIRMYDLGNFQIATGGMQSTGNTVGQLWCSYEIEFEKPRINPDPIVGGAHWTGGDLSTFTPSLPFGNTGTKLTPVQGSSIPMYLAGSTAPSNHGSMFWTDSTGEHQAQTGLYSIFIRNITNLAGAGNTGAWTFTAIKNATFLFGEGEIDAGTASARTISAFFVVRVTGPNAEVSFSNNSTQGTPTDWDVFVSELPDSMQI